MGSSLFSLLSLIDNKENNFEETKRTISIDDELEHPPSAKFKSSLLSFRTNRRTAAIFAKKLLVGECIQNCPSCQSVFFTSPDTQHRKLISEKFLWIIVRFTINQWCSHLNKILTGSVMLHGGSLIERNARKMYLKNIKQRQGVNKQ